MKNKIVERISIIGIMVGDVNEVLSGIEERRDKLIELGFNEVGLEWEDDGYDTTCELIGIRSETDEEESKREKAERFAEKTLLKADKAKLQNDIDEIDRKLIKLKE